MKVFNLIFRITTGVLVALVALVFTVLEGTLLVTLDFILYENELLALLQLVLRLVLSLSALTLGITSIVKSKRSFFYEGLCLIAVSALMIPLVSNGFGIYFTIIATLFATSHLIYSKTEC